MSDGIICVRPYGDSDAGDIRRIWAAGLEQTIENSNAFVQPFVRAAFDRFAKHATSASGDLGDIRKHWIGEDRQMFVATRATIEGEEPAVLGCIGVRFGTTDALQSAPDDCETCSVWRLSVEAAARRTGVGQKLMEAAESWAVQHGKKRIQLITGNPVAASFYVTTCGLPEVGMD